MVIVHGCPDRSKNFARVVHLLSDLPVTAYDRRGYGKSLDAQPPSTGFADQADDLIDILDGKPAVVCGQSAGGAITMMASVKAPELFLSVGLWEPPVPWETWWPGDDQDDWLPTWIALEPEELGEKYNRGLIGDDRWDSLAERTKDLLRAEGRAFNADLRSQVEPPFHVDDVSVPLVIGAGSLTNRWMIEGAKRIAQHTNGQFFLAEGAAHVAHTDHPEVWADLVRRAVAIARQ